MLPILQLSLTRSVCAAALSELTAVMTDDEVAHWLSPPNTWLSGAIPARTLLSDFPAVLAAARADRTMAKG